MVSKTDVIIIGENIMGLYAGIKCLEKGYNVIIIEKSTKPVYINIYPILFSDNHKSVSKLLIKYNIETIETINKLNNLDIIHTLISKSEKVPTVFQETMTFEQLCINILNKSIIKILKQNCLYYDHIKNYNAIEGILYLKNNYINHTHYILKDNTLFLLEKLRKSFHDLGGHIYYSTNVNNVHINNDNNILSCNYSNNYIINSDIVISTLNKNNLSDIYNWSSESLKILTSVKSFNESYIDNLSINNIRNHLTTDFNLSIPYYKDDNILKDTIISFNNKQIFGKHIKFYICNDLFSKNKGWIDGSIRMINDIVHHI